MEKNRATFGSRVVAAFVCVLERAKKRGETPTGKSSWLGLAVACRVATPPEQERFGTCAKVTVIARKDSFGQLVIRKHTSLE